MARAPPDDLPVRVAEGEDGKRSDVKTLGDVVGVIHPEGYLNVLVHFDEQLAEVRTVLKCIKVSISLEHKKNLTP